MKKLENYIFFFIIISSPIYGMDSNEDPKDSSSRQTSRASEINNSDELNSDQASIITSEEIEIDERGKNTYKCIFSKCSYSTERKPDFIIHKRRSHTGEKPYICRHPGCNKKFVASSGLIIHERTHTGEIPFKCKYKDCGRSFSQSANLRTHEKWHKDETPYVCKFEGCNKSFRHQAQYEKHKSEHPQKKIYTCSHDGCGKSYPTSSNLTRHEKTHTAVKPYACQHPGCNKRFGRSDVLQNHMRSHENKKSFKCDYPGCDQGFNVEANLKRHQKLHSKRKAESQIAHKKTKKRNTKTTQTSETEKSVTKRKQPRGFPISKRRKKSRISVTTENEQNVTTVDLIEPQNEDPNLGNSSTNSERMELDQTISANFETDITQEKKILDNISKSKIPLEKEFCTYIKMLKARLNTANIQSISLYLNSILNCIKRVQNESSQQLLNRDVKSQLFGVVNIILKEQKKFETNSNNFGEIDEINHVIREIIDFINRYQFSDNPNTELQINEESNEILQDSDAIDTSESTQTTTSAESVIHDLRRDLAFLITDAYQERQISNNLESTQQNTFDLEKDNNPEPQNVAELNQIIESLEKETNDDCFVVENNQNVIINPLTKNIKEEKKLSIGMYKSRILIQLEAKLSAYIEMLKLLKDTKDINVISISLKSILACLQKLQVENLQPDVVLTKELVELLKTISSSQNKFENTTSTQIEEVNKVIEQIKSVITCNFEKQNCNPIIIEDDPDTLTETQDLTVNVNPGILELMVRDQDNVNNNMEITTSEPIQEPISESLPENTNMEVEEIYENIQIIEPDSSVEVREEKKLLDSILKSKVLIQLDSELGTLIQMLKQVKKTQDLSAIYICLQSILACLEKLKVENLQPKSNIATELVHLLEIISNNHNNFENTADNLNQIEQIDEIMGQIRSLIDQDNKQEVIIIEEDPVILPQMQSPNICANTTDAMQIEQNLENTQFAITESNRPEFSIEEQVSQTIPENSSNSQEYNYVREEKKLVDNILKSQISIQLDAELKAHTQMLNQVKETQSIPAIFVCLKSILTCLENIKLKHCSPDAKIAVELVNLLEIITLNNQKKSKNNTNEFNQTEKIDELIGQIRSLINQDDKQQEVIILEEDPAILPQTQNPNINSNTTEVMKIEQNLENTGFIINESNRPEFSIEEQASQTIPENSRNNLQESDCVREEKKLVDNILKSQISIKLDAELKAHIQMLNQVKETQSIPAISVCLKSILTFLENIKLKHCQPEDKIASELIKLLDVIISNTKKILKNKPGEFKKIDDLNKIIKQIKIVINYNDKQQEFIIIDDEPVSVAQTKSKEINAIQPIEKSTEKTNQQITRDNAIDSHKNTELIYVEIEDITEEKKLSTNILKSKVLIQLDAELKTHIQMLNQVKETKNLYAISICLDKILESLKAIQAENLHPDAKIATELINLLKNISNNEKEFANSANNSNQVEQMRKTIEQITSIINQNSKF